MKFAMRPSVRKTNTLNNNDYIALHFDGGGGEIRTHGRLSPSSVFKTDGLNHSPTPPIFQELISVSHTIWCLKGDSRL